MSGYILTTNGRESAEQLSRGQLFEAYNDYGLMGLYRAKSPPYVGDAGVWTVATQIVLSYPSNAWCKCANALPIRDDWYLVYTLFKERAMLRFESGQWVTNNLLISHWSYLLEEPDYDHYFMW